MEGVQPPVAASAVRSVNDTLFGQRILNDLAIARNPIPFNGQLNGTDRLGEMARQRAGRQEREELRRYFIFG